MGIRDSFRRANETVAAAKREERERAAAAVARAKTAAEKAAKNVTPKTAPKG
ncbi:hypothetical protein [Amycolatopsis sp. BJA-103]|uniref:hypothetical protein n=1 Tax=Amycolatopsis sp. BJA-103 TaxID=1911175 RepID=UPI001304C969|nr:hypothetical protein [Amycolatopsis sp. BJA-103]